MDDDIPVADDEAIDDTPASILPDQGPKLKNSFKVLLMLNKKNLFVIACMEVIFSLSPFLLTDFFLNSI